MTDIQSATAEIRRGKKIEDRNHRAKNIMSAFAIRKAAIKTIKVKTNT